jgi:D-tyrosyl-tRNA(Tyr) deacylase
MKVVIQRVSSASVSVNSKVIATIEKGYLLLIGISSNDTKSDAEWLVKKIVNLRIFNDSEDKMNLSIKDINGGCLCISQFTLHAKTKKGNRPSFIHAAKPTIAIPLYEYFIEQMKEEIENIQTGEFGADMQVSLVNDGPVTIVIDTEDKR